MPPFSISLSSKESKSSLCSLEIDLSCFFLILCRKIGIFIYWNNHSLYDRFFIIDLSDTPGIILNCLDLEWKR